MHPPACRSPDDLFRDIPNLTDTVKITSTRAIGQGGYSDIWKGIEWSGVVPRDVAIKMIRVTTKEQVGLERLKMRISREVVSWCWLSHKNIIPFYGLCWLPGSGNDNLPSMVYPFCPAGTCTDYLTNHPTADKMEIIRQVADGLIYLHSQPKAIVHGDIKASNILMREDGTPMLADFGLSRVVMETSTGWTTSSSRGSCRWMAPQLFGGIEHEVMVPVTVESDVWAFGCLCIEILAQCLPWESLKNEFSVIKAVSYSRRQPPLPSDLISTILGHILQHCWAYEPADRPSISQLSLALLYDDPSILHSHGCVLFPPEVPLSDSPPPIISRDTDSFTRTVDLSIFREGDEPLVPRTKTPIALRPIDPPLFSPPLSMTSNPHLPSGSQAMMTPDSHNTGATPFMDSLALTPSSQSSSGPASRDEPSLFEPTIRPGPTPLPAAGRQPYVKRIQRHREVSNPIWPRTPSSSMSALPSEGAAGPSTSVGEGADVFQPEAWRRSDPNTPCSGTRSSSRASFHFATPPRIDSRPNLQSHQSQHSQGSSQLLMTPVSSSGRSSGRSPATSSVSSLQHTPITPNSQLPQQNPLQQYVNTAVPTSPTPSSSSSYQYGHYEPSTPQRWSPAQWSPPASHARWNPPADPRQWSPSTVPRDFHLAPAGTKVRITTPDGRPVILPERDRRLGSSPVKDGMR